MKQGELFEGANRQYKPRSSDGPDKRKLVRALRSAEPGRVNGMSKAQLRRYAPAKLPRVTIND